MTFHGYNKVDSEDVFDIIRSIRDPELPNTLEELKVVSEELIEVEDNNDCLITIYFKPTVPHCHLAPTIALCMRQKIAHYLPKPSKLNIYIKPGTHQTELEKRYMAALETPAIMELVEKCISEDDY
ncbi:DUF59 family protein [Heterostelium album PN500]|uniref:DUF59 family protein n=1 Tax=Heterostelium pallidum (strain ATCC 26659 / Pp 5 / PN500) TaxID=670386 RepID=D3B7Q5_HETP5|nr:DUF59 family protein [Heterostelium album PN500]EFA82798.1 DUF59 family protein [Heterostelium album PN500]|eukprot:XP_020434915.1 DUF59 family protein [Heterostelium album PN500]